MEFEQTIREYQLGLITKDEFVVKIVTENAKLAWNQGWDAAEESSRDPHYEPHRN